MGVFLFLLLYGILGVIERKKEMKLTRLKFIKMVTGTKLQNSFTGLARNFLDVNSMRTMPSSPLFLIVSKDEFNTDAREVRKTLPKTPIEIQRLMLDIDRGIGALIGLVKAQSVTNPNPTHLGIYRDLSVTVGKSLIKLANMIKPIYTSMGRIIDEDATAISKRPNVTPYPPPLPLSRKLPNKRYSNSDPITLSRRQDKTPTSKTYRKFEERVIKAWLSLPHRLKEDE